MFRAESTFCGCDAGQIARSGHRSDVVSCDQDADMHVTVKSVCAEITWALRLFFGPY